MAFSPLRHVIRLGLLAALFLPGIARAAPPLQLYIALTPPGGVLKPEPGTYAGPVVIDKAITIDGGGKVTLDGGGEGTVLTINADNVSVRGLHLTHSGASHDKVDAAVLVRAHDAVIENNVMDRVLFGVHLRKAEGATIRNNHISSLPRDISLRGDAIRLWYSSDNLIEGNDIADARDLVFSNAADNRIIGNRIHDSRVGMEFVYSPGNEVAGNTIDHNVTGIAVIYSSDLNIHDNRIWNMRKLTGSGISLKESFNAQVNNNEIAHCAVGVLANAPLQPENILFINNNLLTYNDVAMYFYGEKGGHVLHGNHFDNNFLDVMGSGPHTVRDNHWQGNQWDRYQGFDLDGDGVGDQPHRVWLYADRIWMERSMARFFRGTPALAMIDFVERLIPSSVPDLVLQDEQPQISTPGAVAAISRPAAR